MIKKDTNQQLKLNKILIAAIILLLGYSVFLNYEIAANRSASESVDRSLAEEIFKLNVKNAESEQNK